MVGATDDSFAREVPFLPFNHGLADLSLAGPDELGNGVVCPFEVKMTRLCFGHLTAGDPSDDRLHAMKINRL